MENGAKNTWFLNSEAIATFFERKQGSGRWNAAVALNNTRNFA